MFVQIARSILACYFERAKKGRASRQMRQEFEHIRMRCRDRCSWANAYSSIASRNINNDVIVSYPGKHSTPNQHGFTHHAHNLPTSAG